MTSFGKLIKLNRGDVYAPKVPAIPDICIQIAAGPDCAIFLGECTASTFEGPPQFRVSMNLPSLRRHFRKAGHFPLAPGLDEYMPYGYKPVGSSEQWRFTLQGVEALVPITLEEYERLESMSAWETEHIYERVRSGERFESLR